MSTTVITVIAVIISAIVFYKFGKWNNKIDAEMMVQETYDDAMDKIEQILNPCRLGDYEIFLIRLLKGEGIQFGFESYKIIEVEKERGYVRIKLQNKDNNAKTIWVPANLINQYERIVKNEANKFENLPIEKQEMIKTTLKNYGIIPQD